MSLLGNAALAMWWDMATDAREEFEDWHSHEHFPERLRIPGFQRASRWASADGGEAFFVMYELESFDTLSSPAYVARLNAPTPWSTKMMPRHRNMVRAQCRVVESHGSGAGRHAFTLRFSAEVGRDDDVQAFWNALIRDTASRPGMIGGHLLRDERPDIAQTTEQRIRGGGDKTADWVFVGCAYDPSALARLRESDLAAPVLSAAGVRADVASGLFVLSHTATPGDVT